MDGVGNVDFEATVVGDVGLEVVKVQVKGGVEVHVADAVQDDDRAEVNLNVNAHVARRTNPSTRFAS